MQQPFAKASFTFKSRLPVESQRNEYLIASISLHVMQLSHCSLKRHSPLYILMPENLNAPALLHPLLAKISRTVRTRVCPRDASCIPLRRITSVSKKTPARAAFLARAVPRHSPKTMRTIAIENFQKQQKTKEVIEHLDKLPLSARWRF